MLATSALDQAVALAARLAGRRTMFVSPRGTVLLVRSQEEPWDFPIGLATEETRRVDSEFRPEAFNFYNWLFPKFVLDCDASLLHPEVHARLELLADQFPAAIATYANFTSGDDMSTRSDFIAAQSRATRVLQAFGDSTGAPPFVSGESLLDYRARLLAPHMKFSGRWKDVPIEGIRNAAVLEKIEAEVFADALAEATHPSSASMGAGELRPVITMDGAGRPITRYVGDPDVCWNQFNPPYRHVRRFNTAGRA